MRALEGKENENRMGKGYEDITSENFPNCQDIYIYTFKKLSETQTG